jgi:adenine-specific DNA-methyltransferase
MKTNDLTDENIDKISKLFPKVITEKEDEDGKIIKGIDFDLLKQELSKEIVEGGDERYRLDWPGKKASLLKANTPINKTLRPCKKESVDFDKTENVYIEGDNFEVLKILQESYLGKIKMIYIDPPYNTGKDFVYKDSTTQSKKEYEEEIGVEDEEGGKLFKNTDTNGRFHSDWLSMMYERLIVARDLLKDDGVIFMSIDDNEVHNLRKIADEIFGEDNFVSEICWHNNVKGRQMDLNIKNTFESILIYSKNNSSLSLNTEKEKIETNELDKDKISYYKKDYPLHNGTADFHINNRPNLCYSIYYYPKNGHAVVIDEKIKKDNSFILGDALEKGRKLMEEGYIRIVPKFNKTYNNQRVWRWGKEKFLKEYNTELLFIKENNGYYIYQKKRFNNGIHEKKFKNYINIDGGSDKTYLVSLFKNNKFFDSPKPRSLIVNLLKMGSVPNKNDLVLDFFSGSGTTADSVMQLNAEDGGNRKFIMAQLPEKTDEKSEAFKAGYKNISDIGKERIRRAGKKILEDNVDKLKERETPLDIGFRVYKTDTTNMKDVYYNPSELKQENLLDLVSNVKEDRNEEDLLTQVILDLGLTLDLPIEEKAINNSKVFFVEENSLVACFDEKIEKETFEEIAKIKPLKVVFRDSSFKDTKDKINIETIFKQKSPETKVTVI